MKLAIAQPRCLVYSLVRQAEHSDLMVPCETGARWGVGEHDQSGP